MKKQILLGILQLYSLFCTAQANVPDTVSHTPLRGKIINVIGDSYVRNHKRPYSETWHAKVAKKYGMTYRNYGRNGGCIAFDRSKEGFGKPLTERFAEMNDTADYVLVIAGHNDAEKVKNSTDSLQMFRQAMAELCEKLIAKYPRAKIAFVTPWNVRRDGFQSIIRTMEEVCATYSIPLLNAAKTSGIYVWDEAFRRIYFQSPSDTAHLNDAGHNLFLNKGETFLLGL